jgi:hypothetical protein
MLNLDPNGSRAAVHLHPEQPTKSHGKSWTLAAASTRDKPLQIKADCLNYCIASTIYRDKKKCTTNTD